MSKLISSITLTSVFLMVLLGRCVPASTPVLPTTAITNTLTSLPTKTAIPTETLTPIPTNTNIPNPTLTPKIVLTQTPDLASPFAVGVLQDSSALIDDSRIELYHPVVDFSQPELSQDGKPGYWAIRYPVKLGNGTKGYWAIGLWIEKNNQMCVALSGFSSMQNSCFSVDTALSLITDQLNAYSLGNGQVRLEMIYAGIDYGGTDYVTYANKYFGADAKGWFIGQNTDTIVGQARLNQAEPQK